MSFWHSGTSQEQQPCSWSYISWETELFKELHVTLLTNHTWLRDPCQPLLLQPFQNPVCEQCLPSSRWQNAFCQLCRKAGGKGTRGQNRSGICLGTLAAQSPPATSLSGGNPGQVSPGHVSPGHVHAVPCKYCPLHDTGLTLIFVSQT